MVSSMAESLAAQRTVNRCKVASYAISLEEEDKVVLISALEDRENYTDLAIERALRAEGAKIGRTTIRSHRVGECCCYVA